MDEKREREENTVKIINQHCEQLGLNNAKCRPGGLEMRHCFLAEGLWVQGKLDPVQTCLYAFPFPHL
jgi:hypothetical protein